MSDGLARASGAPMKIPMGGKDYLFEPLGFKDMGSIEQEYIRQKPDPLAEISGRKAILDKEDYDRLLDKAYIDATSSNQATPEEVAAWIDTRVGLAYTLWISLLKTYPDMEYEFVEDLMEKATDDEIAKLIKDRDQVSGLDEAGNSTGRTAVPEGESELPNGKSGENTNESTEAEIPVEKESVSLAGDPSTENLPRTTTGPALQKSES